MKALKNQFKTILFLLIVGAISVGCSSDDDIGDNGGEPSINEGNASAVINVDNQIIEFSSETDNSFATITQFEIEGNEIDKLTIIMADDNSGLMIAVEVAPAPNSPMNYDLSNVGFGQDYMLTATVLLDGENSSETDIYGVGSYSQDGELTQSQGLFKITSITNTTIKGTFNMTLYNSYSPNDDFNTKELTVTEGEFELPIVDIN
ncbi:hypothetical protein [Psychroflexus halocasei]|uniref:Uncharacterized protein n=2 Tax=Psychroflexus TaxID=83612 RepID=A0A1H4AH90_9FLAO|nr:hypothetical protein [Psychroflexus halocasei]SEA35111.1 hypothetical protein SAMN05421540_10530 [Psychroflexus halocasei]